MFDAEKKCGLQRTLSTGKIAQLVPNGGSQPGTGSRKQTAGSPKSFHLI